MNWLKPTIFWKLRFSFGLGRYYAKGVKVGGGLNYFFVGLVSGRKWRRNLELGKNEWVGSIYCHIRFERNSSEWRWKWEEEKNWHWGCWVWLRVWKYELAQKWKVSASKKSPARENMTSNSKQIQRPAEQYHQKCMKISGSDISERIDQIHFQKSIPILRVAQVVQAFKPGFEDFSNLWGFLRIFVVSKGENEATHRWCKGCPQSSVLNPQSSILSPQSSILSLHLIHGILVANVAKNLNIRTLRIRFRIKSGL